MDYPIPAKSGRSAQSKAPSVKRRGDHPVDGMHGASLRCIRMKTRVTITLDPEVHARAKTMARARRTTVAGLIEAFLRSPDAAGSGGSLVDEISGAPSCAPWSPVMIGFISALHSRHIARRRSPPHPTPLLHSPSPPLPPPPPSPPRPSTASKPRLRGFSNW